jgi:hypothetical protein
MEKLQTFIHLPYFCFTNFFKASNQRFALAAGGRAWIRLGSRKSPKPEKMLENGAESHQSAARFVGTLFVMEEMFSKIAEKNSIR